jgi:predicted nucleotidyltransferase
MFTKTPDEVVSVADAREGFSKILRGFRTDFDPQPVIVGAHRKPEAVIVPYEEYVAGKNVHAGSSALDLEIVGEMSEILHKLAAMNNIAELAVFGNILTRGLAPEEPLDLLVGPTAQATYFDLVQFASEMEIVLRRFVNVVNRDGLHPLSDADVVDAAVYF